MVLSRFELVKLTTQRALNLKVLREETGLLVLEVEQLSEVLIVFDVLCRDEPGILLDVLLEEQVLEERWYLVGVDPHATLELLEADRPEDGSQVVPVPALLLRDIEEDDPPSPVPLLVLRVVDLGLRVDVGKECLLPTLGSQYEGIPLLPLD